MIELADPGESQGLADLRVAEASGYDWLLNKCCDLDEAAHAGHLDEGELVGACSHCQCGEGRRP